jgi:hypothetical protein
MPVVERAEDDLTFSLLHAGLLAVDLPTQRSSLRRVSP